MECGRWTYNIPLIGRLRRLPRYRFPIQCEDDSGGGMHTCNIPHCILADSSNDIQDMPELEVLSSGTIFLVRKCGTWFVSKEAMREIEVLFANATDLAFT